MVKTILVTKETKELEKSIALELSELSSGEAEITVEDLEKLIAKNKKQEKVKEK